MANMEDSEQEAAKVDQTGDRVRIPTKGLAMLLLIAFLSSAVAQPTRNAALANKASKELATWKNAGMAVHWDNKAESTDSTDNAKKGSLVGLGAAVAFFITLGMVEAFKTDCPDHISTTSWSEIAGSQRLNDGDQFQLIDVTFLTNVPPGQIPAIDMIRTMLGISPGEKIDDGQIAIDLIIGKAVSWRKYILAGDASSNQTRTVASAEGAQHQSGFFFIPSGSETEVVFSKPKRWGHLCKMYQINGTSGLESGHIYLLSWDHD